MFLSDFDPKWLMRLHSKNSNLTLEELKDRLLIQHANFKKYLVTFDRLILLSPDNSERIRTKFVGATGFDTQNQFIILNRSDHVYGPYWTTSNVSPEMQDGAKSTGRFKDAPCCCTAHMKHFLGSLKC